MIDRLVLAILTLTSSWGVLGFAATVTAPPMHIVLPSPSASPPSKSPWKIDASPQTSAYGQSVTFTLFGPANSHVQCLIEFGDESPSASGAGQSSPHSTIEANSVQAHVFRSFGTFLVRVTPPCQSNTTVNVNPPVPPPASRPGGWALVAVPPTGTAGSSTTFVLFAPLNRRYPCRILFGDEQGHVIGAGAQILTDSTVTHTYSTFGQFKVVVSPPCQGQLMLTVNPPVH